MTRMRPIVQDLVTAGAVQLLALLFAATMLDLGEFMLATRRLSAAYWCGVILVLARRHAAPTAGDQFYLRWGLLAVLAFGIPATLIVWGLRGVI